MELIARNTNDLAPRVYRLIHTHGILEQSRNGPALRLQEPVTVVLTRPWERVNFCPVRNANPYFHFMEAMAMLAPFNCVGFVSHFAKAIAQYSDDGKTFNAFYGTRAFYYRLFHRTDNQIATVINKLKENPNDRQAVVLLWDPMDNHIPTKDKACNLMMLFSVVNGRLRLTTFNRSNDAVLGGVSGANIVHFSYFHEFVATALGLPMGEWWHTSNNLHAYCDTPLWQKVRDQSLREDRESSNPYLFRDLQRPAMFQAGEVWLFWEVLHKSLLQLLDCINRGHHDLFIDTVTSPYIAKNVIPMFNSWQMHKRGFGEMAKNYASAIEDPAWRLACITWLERRELAKTDLTAGPDNTSTNTP